ncbi:hypothetical protein [Actibacterium pelagium]|nr:hypothetical protein [Actibacterium pelagium]
MLIGSLFFQAAEAQETVTGVNPMEGFEHSEMAGFNLTGRHAEIICESCHIDNKLEGTPRDCVSCHNGGIAPGKPATHPAAGNTCSDCHTTRNFVPFAFDHVGINQECATCHNGSKARAKPANHIAASDSCDDCHVTTGFQNARVDHTQVIGVCATCHDGVTAPGQPVDHIKVGDDCASCHSTFQFAGAILDHNQIDQPCATCHNGTTAVGKPVNHIPAPETCGDCHTPFFEQSFTQVDLDHDVVPGDCVSCHYPGNPIGAPFQPAAHPPASNECSECHDTFAFSIGRTFDHDEVVGNCADCHFTGNSWGAPVPPVEHVETSETCDGCHTSTDSFSLVSFDHTYASSSPTACVNCHSNGSFVDGFSAAWRAKPTGAHTGTSDNCGSCHEPGTNWTVSSIDFEHSEVTSSDCASCHVGGGLGAPGPTSSAHITGITSTSCGSCHDTDGFDVSLAELDHSLISSSDCALCHQTGELGATTQPSWHSSNGWQYSFTCSSCHTTAPTNGFGSSVSFASMTTLTFYITGFPPSAPGSRYPEGDPDADAGCVDCHSRF